MQCNAVSLAVEGEATKAVGTNRMDWLQYFAAKLLHLGNRVANPPLGVEVDENAARAADLVRMNYQATAIAILMIKDRKGIIVELLLGDFNPKHGSIKGSCAIKVAHGNIEPDRTILLGIKVTHVDRPNGGTSKPVTISRKPISGNKLR